MTPQEIVKFLECRRWPLNNEKRLQTAIVDELAAAGIVHQREVRLSSADVIDFMFGDIGIEVKIKGQRREIYAQCVRYCQHERVRTLVLATNAAMGMPAEINGRPVLVASLGKGWL